jgi:hypothetical protein
MCIRDRLSIDQRDGMAVSPQVVGGRQSRRSGADNGHPFSAVGRTCRLIGRLGFQVRVSNESLQLAHGHRIIRAVAATALFARFRADSAQHGRQGDVVLDRGDGVAQAFVADLLQHQGNVHVGGAGEEARRQAVADVFAEQQFEGRATHAAYRVAFVLDLHAVDHARRAGWYELAAVFVADNADQARGAGFVAFQKAEGGDLQSQHLGGIQDRGAGRYFHLPVVNR